VSQTQNQSPLDSHRATIEQWVATGYSNTLIVNALANLGLETSERSLRRAFKRWGLSRPRAEEQPGLKIEGDDAEVTGSASFVLNTPDDLLNERGLNPDEWEVNSLIVNEWDSPLGDGEMMKQLKIQCKRRRPKYITMPAEIDLGLPPRRDWDRGPYRHTDPRLVVLVGDQQAPFHDPLLHSLFLDWLEDNEPDEGVLMGDTGDMPNVSRHPAEPEHAATTQECVNAVGKILYDYTVRSIDTQWTMLAGNHDERLRRIVINQLADYYGLKPAEIPGLPDHPPIHDPRHLYRLNELGIKYIVPDGSYEHAQVQLSPYVAAMHGWIARKGSGASALSTLDHLGYSVFVGHTHRQSRVHQTKNTIDGDPTTITAVETGCMCLIKGGLGYSVAPDWQNGFATATIWPDGTFTAELATYVDGKLFWRDQRYS
jgi:hypothetical protein